MTRSAPDPEPDTEAGGQSLDRVAPLTPALRSEGPGVVAVDPVRGLLHRYRALCLRAVDPLEIAAGLEVRGVTDRMAARLRHPDVFSLAEALYAQVPPLGGSSAAAEPACPTGRPATARTALSTVARALLPLLPGVLCTAVLAALAVVPPVRTLERVGLAALGAAAVLIAGRLALRPLRVSGVGAVSLCWLGGYALYGDALLAAASRGDLGALPAMAGSEVALSLALAVAPAVWCARWFAWRAGRRLLSSQNLAAFAAAVRPLLLLALLMFTVALLAVWFAVGWAVGAAPRSLGAGAGPVAGGAPLATVGLGVLLFTALLLARHGCARVALAGVGAVGVTEAAALGSVLAGRLPALAPWSWPTETLVSAQGPAVVPVVGCAVAVLVLLAYARGALASASVHGREATW